MSMTAMVRRRSDRSRAMAQKHILDFQNNKKKDIMNIKNVAIVSLL